MLDLREYLEAGESQISNLLLQYYAKIGISHQELCFYLQLVSFQQNGNYFPDPISIAERMGETTETVSTLMNLLIQKKIIQIETKKNKSGKTIDVYDLMPVYEKIQKYFLSEEKHKKEQIQEDEVKNLFFLFEKEFGRPLSPIELEMIGQWLDEDQYKPELIRLALREAVLNQAYNLKYIDRILLAWERKNLKTKEQVERDQKKRQEQKLWQDQNSSDTQLREAEIKVPLYNWLNPKDNE